MSDCPKGTPVANICQDSRPVVRKHQTHRMLDIFFAVTHTRYRYTGKPGRLDVPAKSLPILSHLFAERVHALEKHM
jgi:hypothetical protein